MKDTKDIKDMGVLGVFIPVHDYEKYKNYIIDNLSKKIEEGEIDLKELDDFKKKLYLAYSVDYNKLTSDSLCKDAVQNGINDIKIDNETVCIRDISKKLPSKTLNNGKTKNISFSFMGVAIPVEIPLWHSGFRILIDLIEPTERVRLMNSITSTIEKVGINSVGHVFSNEAVVIEKIIWDFIEDKIVGTTAKTKSVGELRKLIDYRDYPFILNGIIKSITPKGFEVKIPCNNNLENDKDGKPFRCGNMIKGVIDANELMRVNLNMLPDNGKQLGIKTLNSISIDDIKRYQKELANNYDENEYTYEVYNGTITLVLKFPNIDKKFRMAEMWQTEISEMINEIISSNEDNETADVLISEVIEYTLLGFYVHMIDKVIYNDDTILTGEKDIHMALKAMSADSKLKEKIIEDIKNFINKNVYGYVGLPSMLCNKCKGTIGENINEHIEDIIPLNLLNIFFSLSTYLDIKTS